MKNSKVKRFFFLNKTIVHTRLLGLIWLVIPHGNGAFAQNSSYQANTIPLFGSGLQNAAFGIGVLGSLSTGNNNCGFGYFSLSSNTQGSDNTAFGRYSLFSNARPGQNVAIGSESMYLNTDGGENTAIGFRSLYNNIDGNYNVSNGAQALFNNNAGSNNTSSGYKSLFNNTDGNSNTATGFNSLFTNQNGNLNTATGHYALFYNTASGNVANGAFALQHNTTGTQNTAIGTEALTGNSQGIDNTAVGYQALLYNNGDGNTATGYQALYSFGGISLLGHNTANGYLSLYNNTDGIDNVAVGAYSSYSNIDGGSNVSLGAIALYTNEHGGNNTAIGHNAAQYFLDGNESTCVGSDSEAWGYSNATALGSGAQALANDRVRLGNSAVTNIQGQVAYSFPSDGRFKTNVSEEDVKGMEFIRLLRPVVYNFDTKKYTEFITSRMPDSARAKQLNKDFGPSTSIRQSGFIAQEVEKAAKQVDYDFNGVVKPIDDKDHYSMAYSQFVVPLVKAVQELDKQKTEQDRKIEKLLQQLEGQQKVITELQKKSGATTGTGSMNSDITGFSMAQNEPNPFTHETTVKYAIPQSVNNAYMAVYDLSGKQISTLSIDLKGSSVTITSEKLAAGIYIYSIVADGKIMDSKRMIVADK